MELLSDVQFGRCHIARPLEPPTASQLSKRQVSGRIASGRRRLTRVLRKMPYPQRKRTGDNDPTPIGDIRRSGWHWPIAVLKLIVVPIGAVAAAVITFDGGQLLLDVLILALLAD
jgi:hypothetical protein